ncbi:hypothetical protein L7F22_058807 [Adiantum nelumboides]|nr:hypothetical protein [Adiantum nelumboides]
MQGLPARPGMCMPGMAYGPVPSLAVGLEGRRIPSTPLEMAIDFFYYDFENAEPPRVTSLKNAQPTRTFVYYGDDEYFVADKRGYVHILHELAKTFLKHSNNSITDSRLELKKVVTNITYSSHGVKVETEDHSVFSAKYAILSVSLEVLKSSLIKYTLDLPVSTWSTSSRVILH